MSSSMGPVNMAPRRFGECRECWDENWTRTTGGFFESRVRMVGRVCGHRLKKPDNKRLAKQSKINRMFEKWRSEDGPYMNEYWARRALLPDYCGEPGELVPGTEGNRILLQGREVPVRDDQN